MQIRKYRGAEFYRIYAGMDVEEVSPAGLVPPGKFRAKRVLLGGAAQLQDAGDKDVQR